MGCLPRGGLVVAGGGSGAVDPDGTGRGVEGPGVGADWEVPPDGLKTAGMVW